MGIASDLRESVLQAAIQGKLTEQLATDGNARDLLKQIKTEKDKLIADKKIKKEKALAPISDDEKPFEIPDNWEWCKTFELSKVISKGTTPKGGKSAYKSSGINFLRAENTAGLDNLDLTKMKYVDETTHKGFLSRSILEENDILVTIAGTLGRTGLVRKTDLPANCNQAIAFIRLIDITLVNIKYLIYVLNSPIMQQYTICQKRVNAIPNLTLEIIQNLPLPIPPLPEQERIVAKVDELMKEIDELEKIENELESIKKAFPNDMKDAILQAAMQGKLTEQLPTDSSVDDLIEKIKEERKKLEDEGKIKKTSRNACLANSYDDVPFEIPSNWKWCTLNDLSYINGGYAFKSTEYQSTGIRIIRISDFNETGILNEKIVRYKYSKELDAFEIFKNNILMCMTGGTVGKMCYICNVKEKSYTNQRVANIKPIYLNSKFVYYMLLAPTSQQIINNKKTSTNDNISIDTLENIYIPLPPIEEQTRIVEILDRLLSLIQKL